jgi:hypothetical protein
MTDQSLYLQFASRGIAFTATMVRFFECFGQFFLQFSQEKFIRKALERHIQWMDIYFHWWDATVNARDLRRRWVNALSDIIEAMKACDVTLDENYVAHLKEMFQKGQLAATEPEVARIAKLIPALGVSTTAMSSLMNLPSSSSSAPTPSFQSRLPFAFARQASTSSPSKPSSSGATLIEIDDDTDEVEDSPSVHPPTKSKYFALFNRQLELKQQQNQQTSSPSKPKEATPRKLPFGSSSYHPLCDLMLFT